MLLLELHPRPTKPEQGTLKRETPAARKTAFSWFSQIANELLVLQLNHG
jgi:hypothetical protein